MAAARPSLPTELRVGPYVYTVETTDAILDGEMLGTSSDLHSRIRIATDASRGQIRSTLLHEAMHAVQYAASIRDSDKLSPEDFIRRTEAGMLALLRDNPGLIAYLTAT